MFYTIYKTTNLVNGKIYIGSHKTKGLDDGYLGSGKYLKRAIDKHGVENFKKEILFVFDNPEEMYAKEAELVNEDFLSEENTYNLKVGGFGGFDYINIFLELDRVSCGQKGGLTTAKRKRNIGRVNDKESIARQGQSLRQAWKSGKFSGFKDKSHSNETKQKLSGPRPQSSRDKNSQYGTCWITHPEIGTRKCRKDDLPLYIDQGWYRGRLKNSL